MTWHGGTSRQTGTHPEASEEGQAALTEELRLTKAPPSRNTEPSPRGAAAPPCGPQGAPCAGKGHAAQVAQAVPWL